MIFADKYSEFNRKDFVNTAKKIVIKVGTRLLTEIDRISDIVAQIAEIKGSGKQVILVSSGAVGLGMRTLGLKKRPKELSDVQALAAVGQSKLMLLYENECSKHGFHCAQMLLGADDLRDRERHLNILNCLNSLLAKNILPVLNENDSVSIEELKFGDNDNLAALIAVMIKADLTIILTTVDGLLTRPDGGELIRVVKGVDKKIKSYASSSDDRNFSIGGMESKIKAAEIVTKAGEPLIVANGRERGIITRIMAGEEVGTIFLPNARNMNARRRWFAFFTKPQGKIYVDEGACQAIVKKGKSLLPSGVKNVEGTFNRGDVVNVCSQETHEIVARGLVNYSSEEAKLIAGRKSRELRSILGYEGDEEIIHCDNMTVLI